MAPRESEAKDLAETRSGNGERFKPADIYQLKIGVLTCEGLAHRSVCHVLIECRKCRKETDSISNKRQSAKIEKR